MTRPSGQDQERGEQVNAGEDFFKNIFDAVHTGLLIIDPATHAILDANAAALTLIGKEKEGVVGSVCHRFICPAEAGRCPITDMNQAVDRSDRILINAEGKKIPIIKSVGFVTIRGRKYLLENFIDNTERQLAEEARGLAEQKTRAIFDQTYQFIGLLTPDGILTDANRSALKFSGIKESDVIGKPFWDTPWWTHSPELQQKLRLAVKTAAAGSFVRFEATHPSPDGTLHFIDFSLKPVTGTDGSVTYLIPEGRDITDRKNIEDELKQRNEDLFAAYEQLTAAEEELRQNYDELAKKEQELTESEQKTRAIFDQTYQFIGLLTPDGILTDANRSALKFSGIEAPDVIGKPFWDTPWWTHSPELQQKLRLAVKTAAAGSFVRFEATHPSPDRTLHFIDFSLKPVTGTDGSVTYLIPEGRDITDRKNMEDELERKNADLFAAYEQLTATEEELRQNYDELSKKERELIENDKKITASLAEKEVLLREIHHRVKNNLQIIISLLNLQSVNISEKKTLGIIRECQNRVRAMALVHEKIYQSDRVSAIDITGYVRFLAQYLFEFYGVDPRKIRLKIEGEDIRTGINTAVPLGLIINEIISNSLKHAFPERAIRGDLDHDHPDTRSDCHRNEGQWHRYPGRI